jgi:predicted transcriptional regulator
MFADSADPGANLDQFFKGYEHAYRDAYGLPASTTNLREEVVDVIMDPAENLAQTPSREFAVARFNKAMTAIEPYIQADGSIDTEHLLALRHAIRTERRNLNPDKPGQDEARVLLGEAENRITARIEQALPKHMQEQLQTIDDQYRNFRTLTRAVKSGRGRLNNENLDTAIATRSQSEIAYSTRKADQGLRGQAEQGVPIERVFGNPQEARRVVSHASPDTRRQIKSDFNNELWKRSRRDMDLDSHTQYADGARLLQNINDQERTMVALGYSPEEIQRARRVANDLMVVQRMSPEATAAFIEAGPNTILQLISALGGAKTGQRFAGSGLGSSMVMAQYMSNWSRNRMLTFTSDRVYELAQRAMSDPKLYADLMRRPTGDQKEVDRALNRIMGYSYGAVYSAGEDIAEEAPEHRGVGREVDTSGVRLNMYD